MASHLKPGGIAVDATSGNGHDTLFLAQQIGISGHVFAFDLQKEALDSARRHVASAGHFPTITWIQDGHENMVEHIPEHIQGTVDTVVFNLGYHPGGDKSITTRTDSTLLALDASLQVLKPGGMLSVVTYPHPEGVHEEKAIVEWIETLAASPTIQPDLNRSVPKSPRIFTLFKAQDSTGLSFQHCVGS